MHKLLALGTHYEHCVLVALCQLVEGVCHIMRGFLLILLALEAFHGYDALLINYDEPLVAYHVLLLYQVKVQFHKAFFELDDVERSSEASALILVVDYGVMGSFQVHKELLSPAESGLPLYDFKLSLHSLLFFLGPGVVHLAEGLRYAVYIVRIDEISPSKVSGAPSIFRDDHC